MKILSGKVRGLEVWELVNVGIGCFGRNVRAQESEKEWEFLEFHGKK